MISGWIKKNRQRKDLFITEGSSVSEVTYELYRKLLRYGNELRSEKGNTIELNPHMLVVNGVGQPHTVLPGRKNNPFATIAETLWVFAGRNEVDSLEKWLPRAKDYSDDGLVWRAGYGPRLTRWKKRRGNPLNQIEVVLHRLKRSIASRQALAVIYDPDLDSLDYSKDYPCNLLIHFLARNGQLHMHTTVRSNDAVFGVCINLFEWMFLWKYVANQLGIPCGRYTHTANSLHIYEPFYERAREVINRYVPLPDFRDEDLFEIMYRRTLAPKDFQEACEEAYVKGGFQVPEGLPEPIEEYAKALYAHSILKENLPEDFVSYVTSEIKDENLEFSLLEYGQRYFKHCFSDFPEKYRSLILRTRMSKFLKLVYAAHSKK